MQKIHEISLTLKHYWNEFRNNKISAQDTTGLFLLIYFQLVNEASFFQSMGKSRHVGDDFEVLSVSFRNDAYIQFYLDELNCQNLFQFFNKITLKKTKGIVLKSLCLWYQGKFDLVAYDYIPNPLDILHLQSQGKRCISLLYRPEEIEKTYDHNRTVQQFLYHDLEHAWQMFSDPKMTLLQIEMSQKLLSLYEQGLLNEIIAHSDLKKDLDYIFSDMNTHPSHTMASLKSVFIRYYKKTESLKEGLKLTPQNERLFQAHWNTVEKSLLS